MLLHSAGFLELMSILVGAWRHLDLAAAACAPARTEADATLFLGKRLGAAYWIRTEVPRIRQLAALCREGEDSYARVRPEVCVLHAFERECT